MNTKIWVSHIGHYTRSEYYATTVQVLAGLLNIWDIEGSRKGETAKTEFKANLQGVKNIHTKIPTSKITFQKKSLKKLDLTTFSITMRQIKKIQNLWDWGHTLDGHFFLN